MRTIGVDFGTTKTLVATWDPVRSTPTTIHLGRGKDDLPTTIHVDNKGQKVFGDDADELADHDPSGYVRRIKRKLGRENATERIHGHTFATRDLVAEYLSYVLHRVRDEGLHDDIESGVITLPALEGESYRDALAQAATEAGLKRVTVLEEPLAAGISFLYQKQSTPLGDHTLVFDWGGGTLDLAVLEIRDGQLNLHPDLVGGNTCLGGEDLDDLLFSALHADKRSFAEQQQFRRAIIEVKRLLAEKESVYFPNVIQINRDEFYAVIADPLKTAMCAVDAFLDRVRSNGVSVNTVLLAGGTAKMPIVAESLQSRFGLKPVRWDRAIEAVALGAAIRAHEVSSGASSSPHTGRAQSASIQCPACGHIGRGTTRMLGRDVRCKRCSQVFRAQRGSETDASGSTQHTGEIKPGTTATKSASPVRPRQDSRSTSRGCPEPPPLPKRKEYLKEKDIQITSEAVSTSSHVFSLRDIDTVRVSIDPAKVAGRGLLAVAATLLVPAAGAGVMNNETWGWSALHINSTKVLSGTQKRLKPILETIAQAVKECSGLDVGVAPDGMSAIVVRPRT